MPGYEIEVEKSVLKWIAGVLEEPNLFDGVSGADQVQEKLKSGAILCSLMNKLQPGIIKKFKNNAKMPFQQMENIGFVNTAMASYGVPAEYLFVTVDLFEGQNLPQVLIGLSTLGAKANEKGVTPAYVKS